tara:strand:- start:29153 stop:29524 length:372 start_codon:yes stop_codon:yes gene_type:complete
MAFAISFTTLSKAQTTVTFNVDMKYALQNNIFDELTNDIFLKGDISPLGESVGQYLELTDTAPVDSIYSVVVTFPSIYNDDLLSYNFVIKRVLTTEHEERTRELTLSGEAEDLPAIKFNSFDW